jgi:hypothetical protein
MEAPEKFLLMIPLNDKVHQVIVSFVQEHSHNCIVLQARKLPRLHSRASCSRYTVLLMRMTAEATIRGGQKPETHTRSGNKKLSVHSVSRFPRLESTIVGPE